MMYRLAFLIILLIISPSCNSQKSLTNPEHTLQRAFQALKNKDWDAYSKLIVTVADFEMHNNKVSRFERNQSYTGAVLKPEQVAVHRAAFDRAIAGDKDMINFTDSEFVSIGSEIKTGDWGSISGDPLPYTLYSLKISSSGKEMDSRELDPAFYIAKLGSFYLILGLSFAGD